MNGSNPAIEAARQDTERPVTDATGKPLRVGDLVLGRGTVESVNPDAAGCNVVLRTEREMPAVNGHWSHRSVMHLNGAQVVLVERSSR